MKGKKNAIADNYKVILSYNRSDIKFIEDLQKNWNK